jgi:ABC-type lipoprotein export system ATPase subunit
MLELRGVAKTYGSGPARVRALRGVDLSVAAGQMVAVMGPSGSGKSTLLTIAGSLEDPDSGEVLVAACRWRACHAPTRPGCGAAQSAMCSRTSTCCPA